MTSASTSESAIASRNAAISSSLYSRGFHARGFWLKIWIARAPRSTPRPTALAGPPAGETWAPVSTAGAPSMRPLGGYFAPLPAGAVHIGGDLAALYNLLGGRPLRALCRRRALVRSGL